MATDPPDRSDRQGAVKRITPWITLGSIVAVGAAFPYFILVVGINEEFLILYKANFLVIIGLPLAALASLFIVLVLEHSQGPIELRGLGFEFRGATGPILLWILCFLSFVYAFDKLWVKGVF